MTTGFSFFHSFFLPPLCFIRKDRVFLLWGAWPREKSIMEKKSLQFATHQERKDKEFLESCPIYFWRWLDDPLLTEFKSCGYRCAVTSDRRREDHDGALLLTHHEQRINLTKPRACIEQIEDTCCTPKRGKIPDSEKKMQKLSSIFPRPDDGKRQKRQN